MKNFCYPGIIVGCTIGGCCIALCMALLVYRRHCSKPGPARQTQQTVANGSAGYFVQPSTAFTEMHEMECFQGHLDTKVSIFFFVFKKIVIIFVTLDFVLIN